MDLQEDRGVEMWKRSSTSCTLPRCLLKNTYLLLLRGGIGDVFIAAIAVAHIFGFAIVPAPCASGEPTSIAIRSSMFRPNGVDTRYGQTLDHQRQELVYKLGCCECLLGHTPKGAVGTRLASACGQCNGWNGGQRHCHQCGDRQGLLMGRSG